jgi:hypothetical protein
MSMEEVDRLLETSSGRVRFRWAMVLGGEPTLHPEVNRIVARLAAADIAELGITVLTNGIAVRNLEPAARAGDIARIRLSIYPQTRPLVRRVEEFCRAFDITLAVTEKTHMRDTRTAPTREEIAAAFPHCYNHLLIYRNNRIYPCCEGGAVASLQGIAHGLPLGEAWWRAFDTPEFRASVQEALCPHCSHPVTAKVPWRPRSSAALLALQSKMQNGENK